MYICKNFYDAFSRNHMRIAADTCGNNGSLKQVRIFGNIREKMARKRFRLHYFRAKSILVGAVLHKE